MNVKKATYDKIALMLEQQLKELRGKIGNNSWNIQRLAKEQEILKRERAELDRLYREYSGKAKT